MPKVQVVLSDQGDVLGTLVVEGAASGDGAPDRFGILERAGQRVIEVELGDDLAGLAPEALHAEIKANHVS
jgi:hypothetical protein